MSKQKKFKYKKELKGNINGADYSDVWVEEATNLYKAKIAGSRDMVCQGQNISRPFSVSQNKDMKLAGIPFPGQPGFLVKTIYHTAVTFVAYF